MYLGASHLVPSGRNPQICFPGGPTMQFSKAAIDGLVVPNGKAEVLVWDPALPGFGCRVRAGGSKTWIAQYRLGTQQRRESLGVVRKIRVEDARKIHKERYESVQLGVDRPANNTDDTTTLTAV